MTDYKEEQNNEIEALESIYPDELTVIDVEPFHCFSLFISSQYDGSDVENASCDVQFKYTAKYPDELPEIEITEYENLDEDEVEQLLEFIKEQGEENLGIVMVFTIYSAVQEKLTQMVESHAQRLIDEKEKADREKEEAEQKRFEGTRVSIETFLAWKDAFDTELAEIKRRKGLVQKENKKLSGKELFMRDPTLDDSDVKFLEEDGPGPVEVDESLFQDLDDLGLDDNDLDLVES